MTKRQFDESQSEEEDEDFESPAPVKKKKRRGGVGAFVELEAQEDEAEDEDELEMDDGDGGFLDDTNEVMEARELALAHRREIEAKGVDDRRVGNRYYDTVGDLERRYAEGARAQGGAGGEGEDAEGDESEYYDDIDEEDDPELRHTLDRIMPASSWRLWKVKTIRPGVEREACLAILKAFKADPKNPDMQFIASAFNSEAVRGAIYVEAPNPHAVRKALADVRLLVLSGNNVKKVPMKETSDVLAMDAKREELPRVGEWVRLARGPYANDLALVSEVDQHLGHVWLRCIPRLDLTFEQLYAERLAANETLPKNLTEQSRRHRTPQKRVTTTELESYQIEFERPHMFTECVKFRNILLEERTGFLIKAVKPTALLKGPSVKPTAPELEMFTAPGVPLSALVNAKVSLNTSIDGDEAFRPGQWVHIVSGDLQGLKGVVKARQRTGELQIEIGPNESVHVLAKDCVKDFRQGDNVKVISGPHEGETGLVTSVQETKVYLLTTGSYLQISVDRAHVCVIGHDAKSSPGLTRLDGYMVGDFVRFAGDSKAGVIMKILRTKQVDLLTKDGLENVDSSQLSGKQQIRAVKEQDVDNNEFGVGDAVEILEGAHKNTVGSVKHLWKGTVWVSVPAAPGGLVAVSCVSVRAEQQHATSGAPQHHTQFGARQFGNRSMSVTTQFAIMGAPVKIIQGSCKGLSGELRGISGAEALVFVSAAMSEMRVPRSFIQLVNENCDAARFLRRRGGGRGGRGGGGG